MKYLILFVYSMLSFIGIPLVMNKLIPTYDIQYNVIISLLEGFGWSFLFLIFITIIIIIIWAIHKIKK